MSSVLLICAVVVSLAVGVFIAQGLCVLVFHVLRIHTKQVAASRAVDASPAKGLRTLSH